MNWTKSQRQLMELARTPVKNFELVIVNLQNHYTTLDATLKAIKNDRSAIGPWSPRNLVLESPRPWDAVMSLVNIAGRHGNYGSGYVDTVWRVFKTFSQDGNSLCLWLQDARGMKPQERELLVMLFEWVADQLKMKLRIVMLVGCVGVYDVHKRKRFRTIVPSGFLNARAKQINFSDDGTADATITPETETEEPATKIA